LDRSFLPSGLPIAKHHLDRHVAVARVHEQSRAVRFANRSVCAGLFEPCQPPASDKAVLNSLFRVIVRTGRESQDGCPQEGRKDGYRKEALHIHLLWHPRF
jgi:hypothetical protein